VTRIVVVGGGILGTAHAWQAVLRGHEVVQLEREQDARGATVRNFGLVWVSGRATAELTATLRSRELWERLGTSVPDIGFRANGSLTLLRTELETAVAEEAMARPDAADRGFKLIDRSDAQSLNPGLRGDFLAALWCERDAAVESRVAMPAIRDHLELTGRYSFVRGSQVRAVEQQSSGVTVIDVAGRRFEADVAVVCPGAHVTGLARALAGQELPLRRVRLQMMQTAPLGERLTTSIADGDSLRYYPAFRGPALETLRQQQPQSAVAARHRMQLLCVQRLHGGLTIGDTHEYDEPFAFDVDEAPYRHLVQTAELLIGRPLPPVVRRWSGVYAESLDHGQLVYRKQVAASIWLVTGPGGRGMTLGPVLAEQTADLIGL
jgi:FAD dependent oxidoreductase TIGR03364